MQVSIIIVNYNVKYFLEHCLYSVQKAVGLLSAEIIVVDNASSDGSLEYLLEKFPRVTFIDNPENTGFAKANNQALREAKGELILFLNPDTILPEDCLEICIRLFSSNKQVGACGVKMIDGTGRFLPESKRGFPSIQASFYKLSGLSHLFPRSRRFSRYNLGHLPEGMNHEIDILSGAFFMARKEVLDKTGGFDERFFMYGEDIDLSYRIRQEGYMNYYLSDACIVHFKGESTKKGSLDYVKVFYNAMKLFVQKHFKSNHSAAFLLLIEASIWARAGLSATKNMLFLKPAAKKESSETVIIASQEEAGKVRLVLEKHRANSKVSHLEPRESWKEKVRSHPPENIIFVEGILSYKEIIAGMQELPTGIIFGIYSPRAQSIVGSSSKNRNGYILA